MIARPLKRKRKRRRRGGSKRERWPAVGMLWRVPWWGERGKRDWKSSQHRKMMMVVMMKILEVR